MAVSSSTGLHAMGTWRSCVRRTVFPSSCFKRVRLSHRWNRGPRCQILACGDTGGMNFTSDNCYGAAPEILDALARANTGSDVSYGDDTITRRLNRQFSEIFEREVAV